MSVHGAIRAVTFPQARHLVGRHIGTIDGLENLPQEGAFVLVPNHTSYFDHFVAITLVELVRGVPLWILTKEESFRRAPRRAWTKAWYGIPVNRDRPNPSTIRAVQKALLDGQGLGVYPEGTRGSGDGLLPFKSGAFRFALKGGVPVIPMAMVGANQVLPPGALRFRKGSVNVAIGSPLWPDTTLTKEQQAADLSARSHAAIERLLARAADNGNDADAVRLAAAGAALIDRIIVDNLDENSRLPPAWRKRAAALTDFYLRTAPTDPHLLAQSARTRGLRASAASTPANLLLARGVRRSAEHVLDIDPTEFTAHYVLGRWHLGVPRILGGDLTAAEVHFRAAAAVSPTGETRALVGLGDVLEAQGRVDEAAQTILAAIEGTATGHPRAALRTARLRSRLTALEVNHAEAAHH